MDYYWEKLSGGGDETAQQCGWLNDKYGVALRGASRPPGFRSVPYGTVTVRTPALAGGIYSDPDIQGGAPVFVGTRVQLKNLFAFLEAGDSLDDFLESVPSVTREQAVAALELARKTLAPDAHPA